MDKYNHEILLPIAEKLIAAGADVSQLSKPTLHRSLGCCYRRNCDDTAKYPRLSPLACCFAYSQQGTGDEGQGCMKFAKLMLKSGVDLKKDPNAFVFACLRYDIGLVEYLLENGAEANSKLPNGMPVSLVLGGFHSKNCYIAAYNKSSEDEYRLGQRGRFIKLVRLLLKHGADPSALFPYPWLPSAKISLLSVVISTGDVALSKELLTMGAAVVNYDKETFMYTYQKMPRCGHLTPLNECLVRIAQGQEDMLELFYALLEKGADLKSGGTGCNDEIWNPTLLCTTLGCARSTGGNAALREVVRVMLDKGVDMEEEVYALCLAVITLDTKLFEMLLKCGFDAEKHRIIDVSIPTLGPNRFQIPQEKMPESYSGYIIEEIKVNLLLYLLRNVGASPETEEKVLNMAKCLIRNGVDMNVVVGPTKDIYQFPNKTNAFTLALCKNHMSTAMYLVGKGIRLKVNEKEARSIFGLTLQNGQKDVKTAKLLLPHVDAEYLNEVDRAGLSALGYAACLTMNANWKSREESRRRYSRESTEEHGIPEGETDEQRQQREKREEEERKRDAERERQRAADDAEVEELIITMMDAGASPFVVQRDKDWRSDDKLPSVSLLEICARGKRWKQLEVILAHSACSSRSSKDFVGTLVIALTARAPLSCVAMLLDRVDSVLQTFVFEAAEPETDSDDEYDDDSGKEAEENQQPAVFVTDSKRGTTYRVRSGMSVLTSAAASRTENLMAVLGRLDKEKASINALDGNKNTVLSVLLSEIPKKYEESLQMVLEEGADPSIKTGPNSMDSLMLASSRTQLARSLPFPSRRWSGNYDLKQIKFFSKHRNPRVLQLLRDRGSLFTTKDKDGKTAFHYACHSGITQLVEWYLDTFSEDETAQFINLALPKTGMTPSMLAFSVRGTHALVSKFAAAGANLSAVATNGHTALSLAVATRASMATVEALLANGADPNKGRHPLIAATMQNPRVWKLIHKLVDDLDINQAIAQEALNHLLSTSRKWHDPYGDLCIQARCGFGASRRMRRRQEEAQRETQSISDKLVGLGANLEFAKRGARKSRPRTKEIMEWFIRRRFLS